MKNKIIFIIIAFISINISAQKSVDFKSFYKTQKHHKDIIGLSIPLGLVNFFIDDDEKELKAFIKKGDKIRILVFEKINHTIIDDIKAFKSSADYKQFMTVKDKDGLIKFMVKENKDCISEVILFIEEENSLVAMAVYGTFDYDDFSTLSNSLRNKS